VSPETHIHTVVVENLG